MGWYEGKERSWWEGRERVGGQGMRGVYDSREWKGVSGKEYSKRKNI
jgi:hypothetical protein